MAKKLHKTKDFDCIILHPPKDNRPDSVKNANFGVPHNFKIPEELNKTIYKPHYTIKKDNGN